jgi:hypothetical protein
MTAGGVVNIVLGSILVAPAIAILEQTPSGGELSGLDLYFGMLVLTSGVGHLAIGIPLVAIGARSAPRHAPPLTRRDYAPIQTTGIVLSAVGLAGLVAGGVLQASGEGDGAFVWMSAVPHFTSGIALTAAGGAGEPDRKSVPILLRPAVGGAALTLSF